MMADQLDLFSNVRWSDPDTSHAAAALERVTVRQRVEAELRRNPGGLTDHELTERLGLDRHRKPSVGKRRQELFAVDTGRRRRSPDGLMCAVWTLRSGRSSPSVTDSQPSASPAQVTSTDQ